MLVDVGNTERLSVTTESQPVEPVSVTGVSAGAVVCLAVPGIW